MFHPGHEYRIILKPSVEKLLESNKLLVGARTMSDFLDITHTNVRQLMNTDRIPLPIRLGSDHSVRWSTLELLEWVAAGCPGRGKWIDKRGWTGWMRRRGRGLIW